MAAVYYVTFGQKYRHRRHPIFHEAHPDGYITLTGVDHYDRGDALDLANDIFMEEFSNIYPEGDFKKSDYPKGELFRYDVSKR